MSDNEVGELTEAIYVATGDDTFETMADVPFDTWKRRQALGMIERGPHGEPVLTAHGWKTQSRIESGLAVPEFDADEAI
jgi:hypothetical protein